MFKHPIVAFSRPVYGISLLAVMLLGLAALHPAHAATPKYADCPPVGTLPGYTEDNKPTLRPYAQDTFPVTKGSDTVQTPITGRYCNQTYSFTGSGDPMSVLEKQANFHQMFEQMGAKLVYTDDSDDTATLTKGGKTLWMYVHNNGESYINVTVIEPVPFVATLKAPTSADCAPLGHMPNYSADDKPTRRNYDQYAFTVGTADNNKQVNVQGATCRVSYSPITDASLNSSLETQLNYRAALKKLGAQIVFTDDGNTDARLNQDGQTIWLEVHSNGDRYQTINVVKEKAFKASFKPPQASALKTALDKNGRVALYIDFDFNKATLRPDAAPVIAQVVALLKNNPTLKLSVQGNTDNVGDHDYNVKLSQARAAAVVATLVKDGITANRLTSSGNGPDKPIASNDTSAGRAKNRRVDLVKA